jgi:hypothetical protein
MSHIRLTAKLLIDALPPSTSRLSSFYELYKLQGGTRRSMNLGYDNINGLPWQSSFFEKIIQSNFEFIVLHCLGIKCNLLLKDGIHDENWVAPSF